MRKSDNHWLKMILLLGLYFFLGVMVMKLSAFYGEAGNTFMWAFFLVPGLIMLVTFVLSSVGIFRVLVKALTKSTKDKIQKNRSMCIEKTLTEITDKELDVTHSEKSNGSSPIFRDIKE